MISGPYIVLAACLLVIACSGAAVPVGREAPVDDAPDVVSSSNSTQVALDSASFVACKGPINGVKECEELTIAFNKCHSLKGYWLDNVITQISTGECTNCEGYDDYACKNVLADFGPSATQTVDDGIGDWGEKISSFKCFFQCPS